MRSTLQFILKFKNVLFFAGLQILAFAMLLNTQGFHQTVFMEATGDVVGRIETRRNDIRSYLHLREENQSVNDQIADLQNTSPASYIPLGEAMRVSVDSARMQKYLFTPAQVVNLRTTGRANFITLDRGSAQGVKPRMGVVSGNSIVGFIKDVSENYSVVLPIIHTNFSTSVRLVGEDAIATLEWTGAEISQAQIQDFPRHVRPEAGDTIVTTAFSNHFPPNMIVGTVNQVVKDEAGSFQQVNVDLAVDFLKLNYVQIVENLILEERIQLEATLGEDG